MLSVPQYVIFWCLLFTMLGAVWYALDRRYGARIYRKWYDLTHEHPLPEGQEKGFVYNRGSRARLTAATIVSTAQSLAVIVSMEVNLLVEFIMWIAEVPITMAGFYVGPWVYRLWGHRERLFATLDKMEERADRPAEAPTDLVVTSTTPTGDEVLSVRDDSEPAGREPREPGPSRAELLVVEDDEVPGSDAEVEPEEEEDPRELMRSYARKRGY